LRRPSHSVSASPTGSGTGREVSEYGIEDYIEIKYVTMAGIGT